MQSLLHTFSVQNHENSSQTAESVSLTGQIAVEQQTSRLKVLTLESSTMTGLGTIEAVITTDFSNIRNQPMVLINSQSE
ncbi:hypothetical protein EVAR_44044_1 [Eumeta japonica]|uniref:Uncharacterized protein n=1 Tax=Eumeta variegata TaxID=151549 RepID=A0A4C1XGC4_EUMVA|nr:hypothetical protein EVAR_44044_1 [Eumeta japonica]